MFALLFFFFLPLAVSSQQAAPMTFHEKYSQARDLAGQGDFYRAKKIFEDLMVSHPEEIIVFDTYADFCQARGNIRKAIQIYSQWLQNNGSNGQSSEMVAEKLKTLEDRLELEKLMKAAPPWEKASVSGNQIFIFKTNVPEPYAGKMLRRIQELINEEQKELEKIFGAPPHYPRKALKVYLMGRSEEYMDLRRQRIGHAQGRLSSAVYLPDTQEILILAQNTTDGMISHELSHHLIRRYIPEPSRFLDEGLAEYFSFKFDKSLRSVDLRDNLEFINWFYDQGKMESFSLVFDMWAQGIMAENSLDPRTFLMQQNAIDIFYLFAWYSVGFFVETKDAFFKNFFRDYWRYEAKTSGGNKNPQTILDYFKKRLTVEQLQRLDDAWVRYGLGLKYEDV
jgi:tetratricopeptide (TPR) repeat protein